MSAYITNFYEQHQTIIIYLPSTLWLSCKRKLTTVAEDRPVQLTHFEFSRSNCNGLRLNFAKCSKVKWKCSSLRMRLSAFSGDVRTKSMLWLYHCVVGLEGNLKDTVCQIFPFKLFFRFPLPQSGYIFIPRTGFLCCVDGWPKIGFAQLPWWSFCYWGQWILPFSVTTFTPPTP